MMNLRPPALCLLLAAGSLGHAASAAQSRPVAEPPELGATVQFAPGGDLCGPWQAFSVEIDSRTTRDLELFIRIEDDAFSGVALRRERLSPGGRNASRRRGGDDWVSAISSQEKGVHDRPQPMCCATTPP